MLANCKENCKLQDFRVCCVCTCDSGGLVLIQMWRESLVNLILAAAAEAAVQYDCMHAVCNSVR